MAFLYQLVRHGEVSVIYCRGPMVIGDIDDFRKTAPALIQGPLRLVIHLGEVPYIDSTGLGVLALLCVSTRRRAGDMKVAAPSAQVKEALETTMLGHVFEVHPTVEAAVAAFPTSGRTTTETPK